VPRSHVILPCKTPTATVSIVIPVYNALEHVVACLHSVAKHTDVPFRLVIINDGSPDPDIAPFVAELDGATASVAAVNRQDNLGFARTVNEGFARSIATDVVLLNSDTQVTPRWLSKLVRAALEPRGCRDDHPAFQQRNDLLGARAVPVERDPDGVRHRSICAPDRTARAAPVPRSPHRRGVLHAHHARGA
jgi:glycosyltransferase involved in cell wall biosynthesis